MQNIFLPRRNVTLLKQKAKYTSIAFLELQKHVPVRRQAPRRARPRSQARVRKRLLVQLLPRLRARRHRPQHRHTRGKVR